MPMKKSCNSSACAKSALSPNGQIKIPGVKTVYNLHHMYQQNLPVFIEGHADKEMIGRVRAIAKNAGVALVTVDVSNIDTSDMKLMKQYIHSGSILFFHNIEQASTEMLNIISSLTADTPTFQGEPMPPIWVVAAGHLPRNFFQEVIHRMMSWIRGLWCWIAAAPVTARTDSVSAS